MGIIHSEYKVNTCQSVQEKGPSERIFTLSKQNFVIKKVGIDMMRIPTFVLLIIT
ncbi:hypothetical protein HMPREF0530_2857 [Lacticaseibacillus paracasei subsp. paracasei ATCC 25302 = DSM 5622 = JCM 8130]|nr:hypothetical protein HMPREF0530_2857 [Lacticaseibacillus paracasei subsp. paracasei ATCC 25302 = DSM 5622 = JCM 8130]OUC72113.1 hypothetical protein BWK52_1066c [Lacticaseibacillus paracasei]OUC74265.1 hypothetical protein B4Q23_0835c [Lacticaseibacillus paracasei]